MEMNQVAGTLVIVGLYGRNTAQDEANSFVLSQDFVGSEAVGIALKEVVEEAVLTRQYMLGWDYPHPVFLEMESGKVFTASVDVSGNEEPSYTNMQCIGELEEPVQPIWNEEQWAYIKDTFIAVNGSGEEITLDGNPSICGFEIRYDLVSAVKARHEIVHALLEQYCVSSAIDGWVYEIPYWDVAQWIQIEDSVYPINVLGMHAFGRLLTRVRYAGIAPKKANKVDVYNNIGGFIAALKA